MVGKIRAKVTKKQWRSPEGIIRRNDAERGRSETMNEAFDELRKVVPFGEFKGKKKSKVQTLQAAIQRIQYLAKVLNSTESNQFLGQIQDLENTQDSVEDYSNYSGSSDGEGIFKSPNSSISETFNSSFSPPPNSIPNQHHQYFTRYNQYDFGKIPYNYYSPY